MATHRQFILLGRYSVRQGVTPLPFPLTIKYAPPYGDIMPKHNNKIKTYQTVEKSNVSIKNPVGFGPTNMKITIPKGIKLKVKEVK